MKTDRRKEIMKFPYSPLIILFSSSICLWLNLGRILCPNQAWDRDFPFGVTYPKYRSRISFAPPQWTRDLSPTNLWWSCFFSQLKESPQLDLFANSFRLSSPFSRALMTKSFYWVADFCVHLVSSFPPWPRSGEGNTRGTLLSLRGSQQKKAERASQLLTEPLPLPKDLFPRV